jgi:hypothetical protein
MGPKFWNMKEKVTTIGNWYPKVNTPNGQILGNAKRDISYFRITGIWYHLKTSKLKA